jgi:aminoglycoside phosphotransferase family enzyme/predicted kinase
VTTVEILDALRDPAAYPHAPATVQVIQTHISCVFLADDQVFKVKKAVRFPFLDFSTLERRRHFCHEEVRLNRRLASGVYLGVVPIVRRDGGVRVGGTGEAIEYAVHMRRLPEERMLRVLVERGTADGALLDRIARKVARFHAAAESGPAIAVDAAPAALARIVRDNFASLGAFAAALPPEDGLAETRRLVESALVLADGRLRERQEAGRIRDCHGDLRPDHVCCVDDLPIFDCIEFDPALRHCDVASEVAFLAMELEFLDAPALARAFVDAYVDASGDRTLAAVLPLFVAYRAQVRAMVAALTSVETEVAAEARARAAGEARRYLQLAERSAWSAHGPVLVVIGGRSGTGKSTLAGALAARTGFAWLRSDVMRKRLAGLAPLERAPDADALARLYAPAHSERLYAALAAEAAMLARDGRGAILDATFQRRADRDRLRAAVAASGAPLLWIECTASDDTIRTRLAARTARGDDPSDATWEVARAQARDFQPWDELAGEHRLELATDGATAGGVARVRAWLVERVASARAAPG